MLVILRAGEYSYQEMTLIREDLKETALATCREFNLRRERANFFGDRMEQLQVRLDHLTYYERLVATESVLFRMQNESQQREKLSEYYHWKSMFGAAVGRPARFFGTPSTDNNGLERLAENLADPLEIENAISAVPVIVSLTNILENKDTVFEVGKLTSSDLAAIDVILDKLYDAWRHVGLHRLPITPELPEIVYSEGMVFHLVRHRKYVGSLQERISYYVRTGCGMHYYGEPFPFSQMAAHRLAHDWCLFPRKEDDKLHHSVKGFHAILRDIGSPNLIRGISMNPNKIDLLIRYVAERLLFLFPRDIVDIVVTKLFVHDDFPRCDYSLHGQKGPVRLRLVSYVN